MLQRDFGFYSPLRKGARGLSLCRCLYNPLLSPFSKGEFQYLFGNQCLLQ